VRADVAQRGTERTGDRGFDRRGRLGRLRVRRRGLGLDAMSATMRAASCSTASRNSTSLMLRWRSARSKSLRVTGASPCAVPYVNGTSSDMCAAYVRIATRMSRLPHGFARSSRVVVELRGHAGCSISA
jgi:hypothetical protein